MRLTTRRKIIATFGAAMLVLLALGGASVFTPLPETLVIPLAIVFLGVFGWLVLRDLSARQDAEEQLKASEEFYRHSMEGVQDYAIFLLDPQGRVSSWNAGAQRIKGYAAEEIIGQHFSRFYPQQAIARGWPDTGLERATVEGRFEDRDWRVRKDGSMFWADVVITAVRDTGAHSRASRRSRATSQNRKRPRMPSASSTKLSKSASACERPSWASRARHGATPKKNSGSPSNLRRMDW